MRKIQAAEIFSNATTPAFDSTPNKALKIVINHNAEAFTFYAVPKCLPENREK